MEFSQAGILLSFQCILHVPICCYGTLWFDRLEDAVALAQKAARLDSSNNEVTTVLRRVLAVESARLRGNQLFNASKFMEACVTYNEGLDHDPYNTILLCNRAACRSKLGQFEKAVEDCTMALIVQPSYSKARLRRANCNAKVTSCYLSVCFTSCWICLFLDLISIFFLGMIMCGSWKDGSPLFKIMRCW